MDRAAAVELDEALHGRASHEVLRLHGNAAAVLIIAINEDKLYLGVGVGQVEHDLTVESEVANATQFIDGNGGVVEL